MITFFLHTADYAHHLLTLLSVIPAQAGIQKRPTGR